MIDELHGATYFTKLDLQARYQQVRVHSKVVPKTDFHTQNGSHEFLVMTFGLCNLSSTFQVIMNSIFHPYFLNFILVFYDILIYSPNWDMHLEHVKLGLEILKQRQFFVKINKYAFDLQVHIATPRG